MAHGMARFIGQPFCLSNTWPNHIADSMMSAPANETNNRSVVIAAQKFVRSLLSGKKREAEYNYDLENSFDFGAIELGCNVDFRAHLRTSHSDCIRCACLRRFE